MRCRSSVSARPSPRGVLLATSAAVLTVWLPAARAWCVELQMVRGIVRAEASATISSELVAKVVSLPFKPGQSFRASDVLVTFDCRRYDADLRAVEAEVKTSEITVEAQRQLLKHKATGANDLALAEAKLAQAVATADSLRFRTSQCIIKAPYDGRIVDRSVDVFEMPQANAALLKIVKDGQLEIDLIIPSHWSAWLSPGFEFPFKIDETGTTHRARLLHPAAVADPVSRTMKVAAQLIDATAAVRPGMSGAAQLQPPTRVGD